MSILTHEQKDIIETFSILDVLKTLAIIAYAGCGKSFILKELIKLNPNVNFIYFVFTKENEIEAKESFKFKNVKISTINAFALNYIKKTNTVLRENEYTSHEISEILNISLDLADDTKNILKMYFNSSLENIDEVKHYNITYLEPYKQATKLYELMINNKIEITHNFCLKYCQCSLNSSDLKMYDALLLDEAQDTNDVSIKIIEKFKCKKVIVGDNYQQIYQFRDSSNALEKLKPDYIKRLSTTFRCNQRIVDLANEVIVNIRKERVALKSGNNLANYEIKTTAYIARTNAMLIEAINYFDDFKLLKNVDSIFKAAINCHLCLTKQYDKLNEKYKYLAKYKSKQSLKIYIEQYNDVELKSAYIKALRYKGFLFALRAKAKNHNKESNRILTTAHSSKGLEFDKVYLLDDFPKFDYETHSKFIEETNIRYVAITRARFEISRFIIKKD